MHGVTNYFLCALSSVCNFYQRKHLLYIVIEYNDTTCPRYHYYHSVYVWLLVPSMYQCQYHAGDILGYTERAYVHRLSGFKNARLLMIYNPLVMRQCLFCYISHQLRFTSTQYHMRIIINESKCVQISFWANCRS